MREQLTKMRRNSRVYQANQLASYLNLLLSVASTKTFFLSALAKAQTNRKLISYDRQHTA